MKRRAWTRGLLMLGGCGLAAACSFVSQSPQDQKRDWQERRAESLTPAEIEAGSGRWGKRRTLRLKLYATPDYVREVPGWRDDFDDRLERTNQVLVPTLDAQLKIEARGDWQPAASNADLDALLLELEKHDPGDGAELVVALVGTSPVGTLAFHELGKARPLGKHIVLRGMGSLDETRAIDEGLDTLDAEERAALSAKRKRHRELAILLHEVGHVLGAIHSSEAQWLMHPTYTQDMEAFAPANRELMRGVLQYREGADPTHEGLLKYLADYLDAEGSWVGWLASDREQFERLLAGTAEPEPERRPAVGPVDVTSSEEVSRLSREDRTSFQRLADQVKAGEIQQAWQSLDALAEQYPDEYAVQHLACEAGMQGGLSMAMWKPHCDRMMKLAQALKER